MKQVLIVENCLAGLMINEKSNTSKDKYLLGGIFTEFNVKNRNDRIYTADKFLPHLNDLLERKKTLGVIYGEFDHPDVFDTSLSRISHTIESITYVESKSRVDGEIRLLNTHYGKEAKALVDDGLPIFVSSRAAGVTESNNVVSIKKLFTYDAVADPGFSSAKMEIKTLNESLGFNENVNFRIYDMSDESKMNEYVSMKNNDFITKNEMVEYSNYLTHEIKKLQETIDSKSRDNKTNPKEMNELFENYQNLYESFNNVVKYLDYLSEKVQITMNENVKLKTTQHNLIKHNDYLAEQLEKNVNYSEYLAENIDNNINYSKYIAETLDKNIDFSEYIAEHVDKNIKYSEYLAESLDNNIKYSEYIAENLDNNIVYSEYIAENLDNNIKYSEYIAENLDNNIKYSEYIAENVGDNIAYSNYLSESLDKSIEYSKHITEKVNGLKLFESMGDKIEDMEDFKVDDVQKYYDEDGDFEDTDMDDMDDDVQKIQNVQKIQDENFDDDEDFDNDDDDEDDEDDDVQKIQKIQDDEDDDIEDDDIEDDDIQPVQDTALDEVQDEIQPGMIVKVDTDKTAEVLATNPNNKIAVIKFTDTGEVQEVKESRLQILGDGRLYETETKLKTLALNLIKEAKKRKASEESEPHFLMFLSEKKKNAWYNLSQKDKEKVTVAINESKGYTNESDVIKIMNEALSEKTKSFEEKLVDAIPAELKPIWESLDNSAKQSIINQAQFFNGLNESKFESFWYTRGLNQYKSNRIELLNETKTYDNTKLDERLIEHYKNVLKKL